MSPHWGQPLGEKQAAEIVASINAGKPVVGYDDCWDVSLAYGYEDGGKTFVWRNYYKGDQPNIVPAEKLVGWRMFLDQWTPPPSRLASLKEALRTAGELWRREHGDGGVAGRDYWYGQAALSAWVRDLDLAATLDEKKRQEIFHPSQFCYSTLLDARAAAAAFLREHAPLLEGQARAALERAADLYAQQRSHMISHEPPWSKKPFAEWFVETRPRMRQLLTDALRIETDAIAQIDAAVAAME